MSCAALVEQDHVSDGSIEGHLASVFVVLQLVDPGATGSTCQQKNR
jgi:hypothetical protein